MALFRLYAFLLLASSFVQGLPKASPTPTPTPTSTSTSTATSQAAKPFDVLSAYLNHRFDTPTPTPVPTCKSLEDAKYVNRDNASKKIDEFCEVAVGQQTQDENSGSISRTYYQDTKDEMDLAIDWEPGLPWKPDQEECVDIFRAKILDKCNADTKEDPNPANWKAGGSYEFKFKGKPVKFRIDPRINSYEKGICRWNVREEFKDFQKDKESLHISYELFDGSGKSISKTMGDIKFGVVTMQPADYMRMPWNFYTNFMTTGPYGKKAEWRDYVVGVEIGKLKWNTTDTNPKGKAHAETTGWVMPGIAEEQPFRQMSFFWNC